MCRITSLLVVAIALLGAACATPETPPTPDRDEAAAGNDVVAETTPTAPIPDEPPPAHVGGGGGDDGGVTSPITTPPLQGPKVDPIQVTIWNRFLVKPVDKGMPETEIRRLVEESVAAPVVTLRRTAVGYWLVQLAPADPPRGKAEQQAVIATLQKTGAFAVVEPDQIMTIK